MRARNRRARLVASAVSVLCPGCGEPQPAPDNGSDMWMAHQLVNGPLVCVACKSPFNLAVRTKIALEAK
jgi:hypothetical protein